MANESTKWLYEQLTNKGYNVGKDIDEFDNLMRTNADSRKWAYETATDEGFNVGKDINEFTSLVAPQPVNPVADVVAKVSELARPSAASGDAGANVSAETSAQTTPAEEPEQEPVQSAPVDQGQQSWTPSVQDRVHASYQMQTVADGLSHRVDEGAAKVARINEPLTAEGREHRKQKEMEARMAGTTTTLLGLTGPSKAKADEEKSSAPTEKAELRPDAMSPVPYGVEYVDGKAVTKWLMPDGSVTTNMAEADAAEYVAKQQRLHDTYRKNTKDISIDIPKEKSIRVGVSESYGKPVIIWRLPDGSFKKSYATPDDEKFINDNQEKFNEFGWNLVSYKFNQEAADIVQPKAKEAAEQAWKAAEAAFGEKIEYNRRNSNSWLSSAGNSTDAAAIKQLETIDNFTDRLTTHDLDALMDAAWSNLGEVGQKSLIDDCYKILQRQNPETDKIALYNLAKDYARQQSDKSLYNLAVEKNMPKNGLDYFMRKISDMNFVTNLGKGIAVNRVKKTGDMAAYEAANEQYRQDGHKVLDVTGMVAGFAFDPTALLSAGVGGAATRGTIWLGGRWMAGRGASAAVSQAATRQFASTMTGRIVGGIAGGAANFGTFEGIKEVENQFAHGGHIVGQDEVGRYINEGYSASAIGGQVLHGLMMGGAVGWLGPVSGNVSDKLVRATSSTLGKAATRAGVYTGATIAEGTIFSVPEWIEGGRDAFDVWTDNMAMMVGFKAKHILKSAGGVLGDLKASFDSPTNGRKNRLDFESCLRQRMDAPSDGGLAMSRNGRVTESLVLTKDEAAELSKYGYGNLRNLVESAERTGNAKEGGLIAQNAPEIVSRLTDMVTDPRVSEAARAKMYYYATGRRLPMSTVMRGELIEDGNGGFIVESHGANGVITSRSFKNRKAADLELERIKRQTELNTIEIGERYQQTVDFESRLQEACRTVAAENGWDMVEVYRTCEEARRNHLRGGDKQFDEVQQNILRKVTDAMGEFEETGATDAIRDRINEKYGVDIDGAIRKEANRRTLQEQTAIDEYLDELIPDKAKEPNPVEDAQAEDITNQKLLTDESAGPAEGEPIDPRFDSSADPTPDYDPHQPGGEQAPIGRAVMKYQDRQVEVLSGRVVMTDDGTMIDCERSEKTIVIRDIATGKVEMVAPEAILSYEEYLQDSHEMESMKSDAILEPTGMSPANATSGNSEIQSQSAVRYERDDTFSVIIPGKSEAVHAAVFDREGDNITIWSPVAVNESSGKCRTMPGYLTDLTSADLDAILQRDAEGNPVGYVSANPPQEAETQTDLSHIPVDENGQPTHEEAVSDAAPDAIAEQAQGDEATVTADTAEYDRGYEQGLEKAAKADDSWIANHINILSQNTPESMPDTLKGELDAYLYEQQRRAQSVTETPESVPNPTENAASTAETVPNSAVPADNEPQTALSRIPVDEQGEPILTHESVDADTAWGGAVEFFGGKEDARSYVDAQVKSSEAAITAAEKAVGKVKPTAGMTKYREDLKNARAAVEAAKSTLAKWKEIAEVHDRQKAEVEEAKAAEKAFKTSITNGKAELEHAYEEVKDVPEAVEILRNMEPQSIDEAAAMLLTGSKVLWNDEGVKRGVKSMLGYGEGERKGLFGLFATSKNGGETLEHLAEDRMKELCEAYGIEYDNYDALTALTDVLGACRTRGDLHKYIQNRRIGQALQMKDDFVRHMEEEAERMSQEAYHMSVAEREAYESQLLDEIRKIDMKDADIVEMNAIFADEIIERQRYEENIRNEQGRADSVLPSGSDVLRGEQADYGGRVPEASSGERRTGGDGGVDRQNGAAPESTPDRVAEIAEPTEAQKAAGNYKMEHRRVDGYNISIENAKGSVRRGTGADGKPWETTMQNDYGYIRGTEGVDGDHIDVFLSDTPEKGDVFVVDQVNEDGSFDEHKVMYGFPSEQAARDAYLSNYEPGWTGLGAITHVSKDEFKKWIGSSKRKTKPFAEYTSVKAIKETRYDNMGNPIDSEGNLIIEDVKSLNDILDSDFTTPSRSIGLPPIPQNIGEAIGSEGRNVVIKKNIFIKNRDTHPELSPNEGRDILQRALYNPNLVGTTQPIRRPDYKVAIQTGDKNAVVVLDVYAGKDNVEIVGWRKVDGKGLEKMKRQAERGGGQFLILSPSEGSAAALSALPSNVSSEGKDNTFFADNQISKDAKRLSADESTDKQTDGAERSFDESNKANKPDKTTGANGAAYETIVERGAYSVELRHGKDGDMFAVRLKKGARLSEWKDAVKDYGTWSGDGRGEILFDSYEAMTKFLEARGEEVSGITDKAKWVERDKEANELLYAETGLREGQIWTGSDGTSVKIGARGFAKGPDGWNFAATVTYPDGRKETTLTPAKRISDFFRKNGFEQNEPQLSVGRNAARNREVYEAAKGMLESAGIDVVEVSGDEATELFEQKNTPVDSQPNRANEKLTSGSVLLSAKGDSSSNADVPSEASAKIAKDTQRANNNIKKFKNGDAKIDFSNVNNALKSIGSLFSMRSRGGTRYAVLKAENGDTIALRLGDHAANGNNFARDNADKNVSIVIERKRYDMPESEIEFTEATIAEVTFKERPQEVVNAIVDGVDGLLRGEEFTLDESIGRVEKKGGNNMRFHIRTYHGTGADFDKFDLQYVGSGEGAQAYGWGGYVTEVKGIGKSYATGIGGKELLPKIEKVSGNIQQVRRWLRSNENYDKYVREGNKHLKELQREYKAAHKIGDEKDMRFYQGLIELQEHQLKPESHAALIADKHRQIEEYQKELDELNGQLRQKRHLYTVRIPDDTGGNYLDWDGKIPDQIRDKISLRAAEEGISLDYYGDKISAADYFSKMGDDAEGFQLYRSLVRALGSDKNASEFLSRAGLTGIRYAADHNNGGRLDGKKNYVVFNDSDMKISGHIQFMKTPSGTVYGWTVGGKVYLNRDAMNPETPLHEYTHLWDEMVRRENPELWERGKELMKQTPEWNEVMDDPNYADIRNDEDAVASEVHSRLTGKRGAKRIEEMMKEAAAEPDIVEKAKKLSLVHQLKRWLSDMFKGLKKTLSKWSKQDLRDLTAEDFADLTLRDLAEGVNPNRPAESYRGEIERLSKKYRSAPIKEIKSVEEIDAEDLSKEAKEQIKLAHGEDGTPAVYCHENKKIYIFAGKYQGENLDYIVAHESVHAAVDKLHLYAGAQLIHYRNAVIELFSRNKLKDVYGGLVDDYGADNADNEFMAYTLPWINRSEKRMRKVLESGDDRLIGLINKINEDIYGKEKVSNLRTASSDEISADIHGRQGVGGQLRGRGDAAERGNNTTGNPDSEFGGNLRGGNSGNREVADTHEPRKRYSRRRMPLIAGKSLFDWADSEAQARREEIDADEHAAAAIEADAAIDEYAEAYDGYLKQMRQAESDAGETSADEALRAVLEEQAAEIEAEVAARRGQLEDSLQRYYLRENTPEDATRIARDMVNRVEAEVEIRQNGAAILRDILSGVGRADRNTVGAAEIAAPDKAITDALDIADATVRTAGGRISYNALGHLPDAAAGEFSYIERQFSRSGEFSFTGNGQIRSRGDVAYLFRALEDYSVEHVFAAFVKDGHVKVLHIGMGGPTSSSADMGAIRAGYDAFGADTIYLVHNHPSGMMKSSAPDRGLMLQLENAFGDEVPVEGIIIDTTSGRYVTFDSERDMNIEQRSDTGGNVNAEVMRFDKADRSRLPEKPEVIRNSSDVAQFVSAQRLGSGGKVSYLILSNGNEIIGNFHTEHGELTADGLAEEMVSVATKFGGRNVIVYGNTDLKGARRLGKEVERLSLNGVRLLDAMEITNGLSRSANDEGMLYEPGSEYRASQEGDIRFREVEDDAHQQETAQTSPEAKGAHVEKLANKFNTPIRIVNDINELRSDNAEQQERMRRSKAFYVSETGEITVVLPNNTTVEDVAETVLHEVVAHKGLREMIGEENYDAFCDEVYKHLKGILKRQIDKETARSFMREPEKGYEYHRRVAVDELFGRLSEKGFEDFTEPERGIWKKLKAKVLAAINKFLGSLKLPKWVKLGDNELRYILWRSHERLRNKDYVDMARDIAKREELGLRRNEAVRERKPVETTADKIVKTFDKAISGDLKGKPIEVGRLTKEGKEYLEKLSGIRMKEDVSFVLNPSDLVHIYRRHYGDNEKDVRNIPLTKEDIRQMSEIVSTPDRIVYGKEADGNQRNMFFFLKEAVDGSYNLMEVYSDRKGNLTAKSFFKSKEGVSQRVMLLNESSTLTSVTDGATLSDGTKLPKFFENPTIAEEESFEYRFRDGETGDIWKDRSVGLEERITNAAIRLSNNHSGDLTLRNDAQKAVIGNLQSLLHEMRNRRGAAQSFVGADRKVEARVVDAMNAQAMFDRATVKRVSDLARILLQNGYLSDMTSGEIQRLLSAVKNSTAMHDISDSVQKIMDIMVNNQLRNAEGALRQLLSIRGSKVDARGVEVQGTLDVDGQRTMDVVKKAMSLTEDDITDRIAEALNRMSDPDQTIADQAALEYAGLNMALDYVQNIANSKSEEKTLRDSLKTAKEDRDAGRMTDDAYKQFVETTEDAIRKNKIERAEAYFNLVGRLSDSLRGSIENAKAFREAEKARVSEIHHNANSDMEGRPANEHHKDDWKDKFANNGFVQFLFAPLGTFDQILRVFGNKSANGEGYLWNRFMRGWVDCRNKELLGVKEKYARLDEKAAELFGKGKTWGNLIRLEAKMPKATVSFWDGGEMRDHELTQGNLLYIYMVDKMTDGRMKLRRMGITESDIAKIENFLDPRFKALGDWLQEEFLVDTRNEYNETHKRMFGASMAAIENYFPLKILANARVDKEEDVNQQNRPDGITTRTGSIIKRRVNNLALDVTGADALSVILDHITQMEHWSAYAEWNRDLNTLRTYKRFRNQVINMTTVYGGGRKLWENFNDLCLMAAGEYRPPISRLNKNAVNLAKGVTAAKVSFRMYTALKQFLSAPAYAPEVSMRAIAKSIANPYGDFKWCMENMPIFRERWHSRISGDPRLLKSDMDWKMWRSRVMEISSRIGMTPNAFVDAVTVSIGARAMYETRLKQYLKEGYPTDAAEKRAMQDATILFNQTQQSSESPFLSTMQVDKDWLSTLFTVFRNSSMSYTRQEFDAMRNLKRNLTPGQRAKSIEFMTKQILRDWGVDPNKATDAEWSKAEDAAKSRFRRQIKKDVVRVATFGFILQALWNLGPYLPYIIFGNNDDEKDKMRDDVFTHSFFGSIEGLTGGDVMSAFGNMALSGEWSRYQLTKDMPLASDINTIIDKFIGGKNAEGFNDIISLVVQMGVGMNPQSITDAVIAITDACGDDPALSHEAAIFVMRVLQVPQSQLDKLYFDDVDLTGKEASKPIPAQLARRYAEYRLKRGAVLAPWSWGDEEQLGKYEKVAKDRMKERLDGQGDAKVIKAYEDFEARYKAVSKNAKEALGLMGVDRVAAAQAYAELQENPDFPLYRRFGDLDGQLNQLSKMWLAAKTPEEASLVASTISSYRAGMVKVLQAETVESQQSAMSELAALMNDFRAKRQDMQHK